MQFIIRSMFWPSMRTSRYCSWRLHSIWIQKSVVLLLYHRLLAGLPWPERIIKVYWFLIIATLVPVQVSCFTECHPLSLYWQVLPNPGMDTSLFVGNRTIERLITISRKMLYGCRATLCSGSNEHLHWRSADFASHSMVTAHKAFHVAVRPPFPYEKILSKG